MILEWAPNNSADSRPSACSIETLQLFSRPPPMKKGPQTNDMSTTEALSILAVRVSVLDEKVDLKRQLLFRKAGKTISEKDVRWKEDGNNPVTVIDACPE